ncbi:unnamed protein product [Diamesa serratosioi]
MHANQGNEYDLFVVLFKKQGNEYKKTPYKIGPKKFCDFLRDEKMFYPDIRAVSDFPSPETCPWPSNIYHLFGYSAQLSKVPPIFSTGDYMVLVYLEKEGKLQNGYRIYGTLSNEKFLK